MDKVHAAEGRFCCSSNDEKNIRNSWFGMWQWRHHQNQDVRHRQWQLLRGLTFHSSSFGLLPALFLANIRRAEWQTTSMHYRLSPNVSPVVHCLMYAILPTYVRPPSSFSDDRWWRQNILCCLYCNNVMGRNRPITTNGVCTSMATTWNYV